LWLTVVESVVAGMSGVQLLRRAAKFLHEIASMGFRGGLAVCLLINLTARRDPRGIAALRAQHAASAHRGDRRECRARGLETEPDVQGSLTTVYFSNRRIRP
jgi:hypothetical protein